jgi:hypothetical protein
VANNLTLAPAARRAFDRMGQDLIRVFGVRFVALVASGARSSVAFAAEIHPGDLDALGAIRDTWHRDGLDTPLVLTPHEFAHSLDAFPLEYQAIVDQHLVISGRAPFDHVSVDPQHLRRACEVQAKSHLIHLRQGWVEAAGHGADLAGVVSRSAAPLRALLSNVARLGAGTTGTAVDVDLAVAGARLAGLDVLLVQEILALEASPELGRRAADRLAEYVAAAEQLWAFVDGWTA